MAHICMYSTYITGIIAIILYRSIMHGHVSMFEFVKLVSIQELENGSVCAVIGRCGD
jgi:hypothetical protein